jgi:DNA-binding NarL/FixJ family response regulator
MSERIIRLLLVDDHPIVRKGTREMLEPYADFDVVGEASDGREGIQKTLELLPDVILMYPCPE